MYYGIGYDTAIEARRERNCHGNLRARQLLGITYAHSWFTVGSVRENHCSTGTILANRGEIAMNHLTNGFESESTRRILVVIHDVLETIRLTIAIVSKRNVPGDAYKA